MEELTTAQRERLRTERKREVDSWVRSGCAGLRDAILWMGGRYGHAMLREGLTNGVNAAEGEYHRRAASRRFRALQRLARQIEQS